MEWVFSIKFGNLALYLYPVISPTQMLLVAHAPTLGRLLCERCEVSCTLAARPAAEAKGRIRSEIQVKI